jgi:polygalacturonase
MNPAPTPGYNPVSNTALLQHAIDTAATTGRPHVVVPPGRWEITTLFLRSGLHLELAHGSVLTPCADLDLYPTLKHGHNKDRQPYHLLCAEDCEDIALTGRGLIHGNGPAFWEGLVYPDMPWLKAKPRRISPLLELRRCRRVLLRDFTIQESPGWTVHLHDCDDVRIDGLTIENHLYGPNNDGLDINGCRRVIVSNCFIRGCDDNICIKSTSDARSCEHITVTNCVLESTCSAIGLGAETWNSIRHVAVSNCTVLNAIRMLQIIMWDGGVVEHVTFTNITGRALTSIGTDRAIHFDIQQHNGENPRLGTLRHVLVSNITCETRGRILLTAQDGATMEDITLRDVRLVYPEVEDPAVAIPRSRSAQLSNFSPLARVARAAVVADNISGLVLENIAATWPVEPARIAAPMHAFWGRRLVGTRLHCPALKASDATTARYELTECDGFVAY